MTWFSIKRVHRAISKLIGRAAGDAPQQSTDDFLRLSPKKYEEVLNYLTASPLFDAQFYMEQARAKGFYDAVEYPLRHYVEIGEKAGLRPHPLFDPAFYRKQLVARAESADVCLLEHYLRYGSEREISPHPLFNESFYQAQVKAKSGIGDSEPSLLRYLKSQLHAGLDPHPLFELKYYIQKYSDVAEAEVEPLSHYVRSGESEHRNANPYFDVDFYNQRYGPFEKGDTALGDFACEIGTNRKPNRWFDAKFYSDKYEDVRSYPYGPFAHYCRIGAGEGRTACPPGVEKFDPYQIESANVAAALPSAPAAEEFDDLVARMGHENPSITVIIPVYANYDLTMACIYSALKASVDTQFNLLILDDASPEPAISSELLRLAAKGLFTLLVNEKNLGFVGSVNRAFNAINCGDVLLLNSDTIVFDGWLDRLLNAAFTDDENVKIGTVTPFSNNATICSYPFFCQDNNSQLEVDYPELDKIFSFTNAGKIADLPTAVGFCMLIKRECLTQTGLFDEEAFGKGYGEENDFCLRAAKLGFRHVLAANTFVRHLGSASFGASKKEHQAHGESVMNERYPDYEKLIDDFCKLDSLQVLRRNVDLLRAVPQRFERSVLLFGHREGGGTAKHIKLLAEHLEANGVRAILVYPSVKKNKPAEIRCLDTGLLPNIPLDLSGNWDDTVALLQALRVSHIHVHHFADYGDELFEFLDRVNVETNIPVDFTAHDYAAICPRNTFINGAGLYCGEPEVSICQSCVNDDGSPYGKVDVIDWRLKASRMLSSMRRVIVPSEDVQKRFACRFAGLNLILRPHFEDLSSIPVQFNPPKPHKKLRVGVIGSLNPHKGLHVVVGCAEDALQRQLPLEFVIVGYSYDETKLSKFSNVIITGPYNDKNVAEVIRTNDCNASFFASTAPETFSYTFSVAMVANLYPFAFDLGAIAERIKKLDWGTVLPVSMTNNYSAINDILLNTSLKSLSACPVVEYPDLLRDYYDFSDSFFEENWSIKYMSNKG